ncbi:MBL fold metallo-hydrolase [Loktanella sp. IMCC34160]|uniref:MBL fold metallo-hydrolase n=1 Tax=Loktanella sp. IMCC34160 TaxID=2510646 RepID=UPI00101C8021|nr:MBL fold metallo-hydrolase [Loktanella sp. IMCC34160]RYG93268.1 MBL fold metallo-hydrolase [Loktanella sp. IMCC34160]
MTLTFRILGCGSSGGVPRLGGIWGDCDPTNPKNARSRCSALVTRQGPEGITRVLIDTAPDLRQQLLAAGVGHLDGVVYTHSHADHVHGIDDLRMVVFNMKERLQVWADGDTSDALLSRFGYAFVQPKGSPYPPILELNNLDGPVTITGAGGPITLSPFQVNHGSIDALGFRIGRLAYLPDVAQMTDEAWEAVTGAQVWIVDALRRQPHPTHSHLDQTLEWIARAAPERGILTNMHVDLDYETVKAETPAHIEPAFDGMEIAFDAD